MRVALAMAVLLGHLPIASYKFISAATAVQGFYIISGFYMALVLEGKYKRHRSVLLEPAAPADADLFLS